MIPVVGIFVGLAFFPSKVRAKGVGAALADEALDNVPIVEQVKGMHELCTGKNWVYDKAEREEANKKAVEEAHKSHQSGVIGFYGWIYGF